MVWLVLVVVLVAAGWSCARSGPDASGVARDPDLAERLTPLQFDVTQCGGTEPPFRNEYWNHHEPGIYVDVVDGRPLFSSTDKFDSGTGWPSFTRPVEPDAVVEERDATHGMVRTEIRSSGANSHLGHVFEDGPAPTGQRYCMNSAALRFVPVDQLEKEGLGRFLPLFGKAPSAAASAGAASTGDAGAQESAVGAASARSAVTTETAILAGGCFWGMEDLLRKIPGVLETEVGYTGGHLANPRYEDTHDSKSGHAEAVRIVFDPAKLGYEELLGWFFRMHDPTTLNRQGNDRGTQYRSAIFYADERQREAAERVKAQVDASGKWKRPVVTEIAPAGTFWRAEDDHQDYLVKHPDGYTCHFLRD